MKLIYNISDSERRHHIVKKFFFGVLITERKKERLERYLERKKVQYEESRKIKFLRERERERERVSFSQSSSIVKVQRGSLVFLVNSTIERKDEV
jgi:hypothetical protein